MSKMTWILISGLLVLSMALVACTPAATAVLTPTPTVRPITLPAEPTSEVTPVASPGNEIGGYEELVDKLRAAGATVEPGDSVEQPFFIVTGQAIKVNGAEVQVFEFPDEAARKAVSSQISPEGQPSPTMMIDWIAQPNFWAKGRVIVLYFGTNVGIISLLSEVLGEPITQRAMPETDYPAAVLAAIQKLSEAQGLSADEISVVSFQAVEWSDSCLGLGRADESCLQAITPGYLVILSAGGQEFEFHTNENGSAIRQK
jgi:hypothetical protein